MRFDDDNLLILKDILSCEKRVIPLCAWNPALMELTGSSILTS